MSQDTQTCAKTGSSSKLAIDGGTPVRDKKQNPWPRWPVVDERQWAEQIEPSMREVYFSQTEGLGGKRSQQFEQEFAHFCQAHYCLLLPHGTDAIMAALVAALELESWGAGGEVIVPNYTYIATASAALHQRMSIALVDIDPVSFTISPDAIEQAVRPGITRAILPVHLTGHPAEMDAINAIARRHGLKVIEDCAQAHGARYRDRPVGALGDVGAFSFQSSKNLSSGEGGAVVTDDEKINSFVHTVMNSGRAPGGARWEYPRLGYNFRPSEYVAALLRVRLARLEEEASHRSRMAKFLSTHLSQIKGVQPPVEAEGCTRHAYHLYAILVDPESFGGKDRGAIVAALQAEGIPCYAGYTHPLDKSQGIQTLAERFPESVRVLPSPVAADVCQRSIWLLQEMLLAGEQDMRQIVEAFAKVQRAFAG